ncbi:MAG: TolC family protein, partial [Flavobacteriaceae bacterium]|nr:TolC family protein [Flavobacteriaceae bacterium]
IYNSYYESVANNFNSKLKLQKQAWFPSISAEYFQGKNTGLSSSLYGFQVGLNVPLFFSGNAKKTKMLQLEKESWNQQKEAELTKINQFVNQKNNQLAGIKTTIDYYETSGKKLSDEILKVANMSYKHGEIDFFQYIQSLENALQIKIDYLDAILEYNNTILDIEFINYQ